MTQPGGMGRETGGRGGRGKRAGGPRTALLISLLLGGLYTAYGAGQARAYEQRPNTFSLGLQGGLGYFFGSGDFVWVNTNPGPRTETRYSYEKVDRGAGLGIRLRYSLDPTHAVGISFEDLRFDRVSGQQGAQNFGSVDWIYPKQYQINNYLLDYYLYYGLGGKIGRRFQNSPYVVLGLGMHRDTFVSEKRYDYTFPPIGFVADAGLGWEYFLLRAFAIDASLRGYYLKVSGGSGLAFEGQIGFQYYVLR